MTLMRDLKNSYSKSDGSGIIPGFSAQLHRTSFLVLSGGL